MLLPLGTPVGANFIKDFPAVHATNMDQIDAYTGACRIGSPLGSYTPILKAVTTNPTLGTGGIGTIKGHYYTIFDQVFVWGEFRYGTTGANGGSGNYSITLPFPALTLMGIGEAQVLGGGTIWDNTPASGRQSVTTLLLSTTEIQFGVRMNSGAAQSLVSHNVPFAWAPEDGISWYAHYQRLP